MKEDKKKDIKGMFSGKLLVDDGDIPARHFLESNNDTYLCMHLKKVPDPPNNQPKSLPGTR